MTGARVSELSYFKIEHIKKGKIGVINKGKRREILLADGLRKKLLYFAQKSGIKQGNVFITKTGNAKDRSNLWREMKEHLAERLIYYHVGWKAMLYGLTVNRLR